MNARPNPMQHFHAIACGIVGVDNCYPGVQRGDPIVFPSVVYHGIGQDVVSTLDLGPQQTATAIRFETRDKRYDSVVALSERIVAALGAGGRLQSLLSLMDIFDGELGIHRRIRSVMVVD